MSTVVCLTPAYPLTEHAMSALDSAYTKYDLADLRDDNGDVVRSSIVVTH